MALPDPTVLSGATRFRPAHFRTHSRSPSRSPVRKARFTSQHLDPLLSNLSPESTLRALQATDTIPAGSTEDVLGRSISDASPEEREIGIRAAFAAQKLKEWRNELSSWQWPSQRDRGFGAGFLQRTDTGGDDDYNVNDVYIGFLPLRTLNDYGEKIEDIKDGLESLEMEGLKDHVLTAHATAKPPPAVRSASGGVRGSYGRMRDFTALVTATVIQALPDLAMVNGLVDTWDIRIAVLRELPVLLDLMDTSKEMLNKALVSCRDPIQASQITKMDVSRIGDALGRQIGSFGRSIDKMLDLLDGQDDALPQSWIDLLESMELEVATWKKDAEARADDNHLRATSAVDQDELPTPTGGKSTETFLTDTASKHIVEGLKVPLNAGHRREISEVSIADSVLSDVSMGEVVDARKSQIMLSPKIQLIESSPSSPNRPLALHRASTASIEVIPNNQLRRFDVRRSMSADMLAKMAGGAREATPLRSGDITAQSTPLTAPETPGSYLSIDGKDSSPAMHSPSLMVAPLKVQTQNLLRNGADIPVLPRRSSKRASFGATAALFPAVSNSIVSPISPSDGSSQQEPVSPVSPSKAHGNSASLDSKIQDILEKLPTKIRLGERGDDKMQTSSTGSSRSSTPTPALIPETSKSTRRSSAAEPDIRVYHLHQNGQGRDAKPIKLFVRAVGENGERVMVRVGGGWADLGEYLREYSAHHGSRSASEGLLEVAQYPVKSDRARKASSQVISPTQPKYALPSAQRSRPRSLSNSSSGSRSRSPSPPPVDYNVPPPVPPIPAGYTMHSPTMTVSAKANGEVETTFDDADPTSLLEAKDRKTIEPDAGPYSRSSSMHVRGVSTTTSIQSPAVISPASYTPLGGAGPKGTKSRSATYGAVPKVANDAWVEGMVGKARAVSSNTIHGPTTTTTTKVTSSAPSSRRVSSVPNPAPKGTTSSPREKIAAPEKPTDGEEVVRKKSRLGLGDVSGIKRVFLRRKSTK